MDLWLFVCILTGALFSVSFAQTHQFYFVSTELNWTDAQSFCRREYSDLATIENTVDVDAVLNTTLNYTGKVWIGLHDDLENSWKWSLNDSSFCVEGEQTFKNWQLNQPDNLNGQQYCVGLQSGNSSRGNWDDRDCNEEHGFVCYNGTVNGILSFVVGDATLNWREAQRYCRKNFIDLASIQNQTENDVINILANGSFVWLGLYRHKVWSDGRNSVFEHWTENQPDHGDQKCIAASFSDSGRWSDEFCSQSLPFICYGSALPNAGFIPFSQNETSITLQWNKGNSSDSFVLQFNGTETNISASDGDGPINYTVSSLTAGTKYTFTLLSRSSLTRVNINAVTAPQNVEYFNVLEKSDTSITLQWSEVINASYILQFNSELRAIPASGDGPVTYTVVSLYASTEYIFTLFTVFENATSTGVQLRVVTDYWRYSCGQGSCPTDHVCININGTYQCLDGCNHYTALSDDWLSEYNINGNSYCNGNYYPSNWYRMFVGKSSAQIPETCVRDSRCSSYRIWATTPHPVHYNESATLTTYTARDSNCYYDTYYYSNRVMARLCYGDYYVYRLPRLPGCEYSYCAVPPHGFRSSGQNETSITLRWDKVNNSVSFVLLFNGTETNISAPAGSEPVTYTVSSLSPATKYTFTLFSVFENVRSSGISIDGVTAPQRVETFNVVENTDRSVTLQWSKVNFASYVLQYNQGWKNVSASDGDGLITYTVPSLRANTEYTFILFCVFENARSSGVQLQALTDPPYFSCGQTFCPPDQDCVFINGTAQCGEACEHYTELNDNWLSEYNINGNSYCNGNYDSPKGWYRMFVGQTSAQIPETCVQDSRCGSYDHLKMTQPHPTQYNQTVTRYLCYTYGSNCYCYSSQSVTVKLCLGDFYVYKLQRLPGCYTAYCAVPNHSFRAAGQDETSITLRWDKVNNSVSFVLLFNGTETNISAPAADDSVTYTVSSLTAATKYTFTLFSVFENVTSSGISIDAVTAPPNVKTFSLLGTSFNSITLQWSKVTNATYVLQYNNERRIIPASDGDGPVIYTVSSLSAGTSYAFTLYSVFENARGSNMQLQAVTDQYLSCGQTFCPPNQDCVIINGTAQCGEACGHYTELNDNWLSEYNINGNSYCNGNYYSPEGWYRMFVGQTSAQIPETCVQDSRCSSYRLRMTQPHPTQYNQTVTRSLCQSYYSSCCSNTSYIYNNIKVKLCYGDYYVYKLQTLPRCNIAYCAVPNHSFRAAGQDETSITLRWDKVNNGVSFVLLFNGTETNISAPAADDSVTYTVSSLTAATKYTFTLFSVFENITSSGISIDAVTAPPKVKTFTLLGTSFNSITLQWNMVNNASYVLEYNSGRRIIPAKDGDGPVTYTVSSLSAGSRYSFNLFSVFESARSSPLYLEAFTDEQYVSCGQTSCPPGQDCVIINGTAQCGEACEHYTELNDNWLSEYYIYGNSYCYGNYYSPKGWYRMFVGQTSAQIPETCVQESRCGSYDHLWMTQPHPTQYNQTVTRSLCYSYGRDCYCYYTYSYSIRVKFCYGDFYVYKLQTLPGCYTGYCAVPNHSFRAAGQDETSITLRWDKVNNSVSFVLLFNGTETNISAPAADDSVTYTVSSLTAATKYTFTLFSVFENVRSSGISIDAVTAPLNAEIFTSIGINDTSVTLQWSKPKYSGYLLHANYENRIIASSDADGPVIFTVSSLYPALKYTFTLYSVFENARSSGVQLTVTTDHRYLPCGETFCAPDLNCFINNGSAQCVDPCEHYTVLNYNYSSMYGYCDGNFVSGGWYSFFLGGTRARISDSCEDTCPTSYYLKLAETHPTEYNQSASLSLCYTYTDNCCNYHYPFFIKAKLCYGNFYVYKLFDVYSCYNPYCTVPHQSFRVSGQSETSITLQWDDAKNNATFILEFNGTETNISATNGDGPMFYTVSSLSAATKYTFTLFSVVENVRSSGISLTVVTAPQNPKNLWQLTQNESSITLQWNRMNNVSFVLRLDGTETNIIASNGDGPETYTFSSLTAQTKYTVTLFSVFENVRSSGQQLTAVTAPQNAKSFKASTQNETSITLQWDKVNNNVSFVLQFNGTETNIRAPAGDGVVNHTVSSLTARTKYTFTLFSVFENVRSSGVNITAATGPNYVVGLDMGFRSFGAMTEAEVQSAIEELLQRYGISPSALSIKVKPVQP
ncbi:uncharacterized protein LOC112156145 isoform X3 [Oryzias melastigma]|uniref:uncharacterized protein LOC112156145 isoform X3 n=1 Tax=Oryzias melastigma TaxID=30732 RepID=UPI00168CC37C|nr:uncharacterized protein LOC112156145 isoform X3 [Oryzias melastigma]